MKVVIVGGGFAGVKAALELSNKQGFEVVLISRGADFEYHGALYRTATGNTPLEVILRIGDILHKSKNVEFVVDSIEAISTKVNAVRGSTGRIYQYDELLLCMGNEKNYFGIEGLEQYSHTMYTIRDTINLRSELVKLFTIPHRNSVRVLVVGAGASGTELAGSLQVFANDVAARYAVKPKHVNIDLVDGSDRVLPLLDPKASALALKHLQKIGVNVLLSKKVMGCSQNIIKLDDEERAADIIVWTAGSKSVDFYAKYPEVFELERGKVKVDEYLRVPKAQNIFVLGDNAFTKYSGMAQTALHDAKYVARNLIKYSKDQSVKLPKYEARLPVYVVPIGHKWAVLAQKDKVRSGYYAWLVRRRADLYIYKNFEPIKKALRIWHLGNSRAKY
jgi:NADH:ubiquinone reductase (H+-translocating)